MRNNPDIIDIYKKDTTLALPSNLANFRDVTMSDRDKRESMCKILCTILNHYLGWYNSQNSFSLAATTEMNQYEIEKLNSIAPIRFTTTFRLAPGEAKRVAQRLKYVPLVWSSSRGGWYSNSRRLIRANEDLIIKDTQSPSVVINRYKLRGSRNNWYREHSLKVNTEFFNLSTSETWEELVRRNNRDIPNNYGTSGTYNNLWLRDMIQQSERSTPWIYSHMEADDRNSHISCQNYNIVSFCADLFNLMKEALTIRRNTPEITYSDEEDYVQMRDFLTEQILSIENSNNIVGNIADINQVILAKHAGVIKMYMKLVLKEPVINFNHPSGSIQYNSVSRQVKDIHGNISDFIMCIAWELVFITDKFKMRNIKLSGYNDNLHSNPGLYNTANIVSSAAIAIRDVFDNHEIGNLSINNCFADHESGILGSARKLDYLTMMMNISNWYNIYVPGRTNPYRQPRQIFFGIPNDIPDWYKSQHDSNTDACESLVITNYSSRGWHRDITNEADIFRHVTDASLKALLLNHCHDCFHNSSCRLNGYAKVHVYDNNQDRYNQDLQLTSVIINNKEVAVEPVNIEEIEDISRPIHTCIHGCDPGECTDCNDATIEVRESNIQIASELTEEVESEMSQDDIMNLMSAWSQAER